MKREDLEKLGLTSQQIDDVMKLHGVDLEKHKTDAETAKGQADQAQTQITELQGQLNAANAKIEEFKGKDLDIEAVRKKAADWEAEAAQTKKEADERISQMRFNHALEGALRTARARDPKEVIVHLDTSILKLNDDGTLSGLKEQLDKIQPDHAHLFIPEESEKKQPRITTGVTPPAKDDAGGDTFASAIREALGKP